MRLLEIVNAIDAGKIFEIVDLVFDKPTTCLVYKSHSSDVYFFKKKGNKTGDSVVKKELERRIEGVLNDIDMGYKITINWEDACEICKEHKGVRYVNIDIWDIRVRCNDDFRKKLNVH